MNNQRPEKRLRVAVDIGGTFTDLAAFDETGRALSFGKALSTYHNLVEGIQTTIDDAGLDFSQVSLFLHGSTIVINNLLERTGAKTALITTEGFRDVYEIGRINRPDAYNLHFKKHDPLIPRARRFELNERVLADGSVLTELDEQEVRALAGELRDDKVESVAIILMHSYKNPAHEQRVAEILKSELPGVFITSSHELSQEYREFERTSTVAANAYVGPRVESYLGQLETHIDDQGFTGEFYAVQSTGGLFPVSDARRLCINMLESGPASGVVGAQALCAQLGLKDAIAFDMGGTTAKAGMIKDGAPLTTSSAHIGAYGSDLPIQLPMIDIVEVGTGGGSIARVEQGGALRVGPRSAGSAPGPACYGNGGEHPTVTDANLLLGRLDSAHFLGGAMPLDEQAARTAIIAKVAEPLDLDAVTAADGILQIAATTMSYAVKGVTTERGLDAGAFAMIVYGGAGPLHASAIAREIGISRVIIPFSPGHFSAYGMLFSDLRYDFVRSTFQKLTQVPLADIEAGFAELEQQGRNAIAKSGITPESIDLHRAADMRYIGQEHAVTVDLPQSFFETGDMDAIKRAFDAEHLQRYGTSAPKEQAEMVSLRVTAFGRMKTPTQNKTTADEVSTSPQAAKVREKQVYFTTTGFTDTPIYNRELLKPGNIITGPALIEEHASTTTVWPTDKVVVDAFGNLDMQIGEF